MGIALSLKISTITTALAVYYANGTETLCEYYQYWVHFESNVDFRIEQLIGEQAQLRLCDEETGAIQYIHGSIDHCIFEDAQETPHRRYKISLVPLFFMLRHTQDYQMFTYQSVPEIIKTVFQKYGLQSYSTAELTTDYAERELCVRFHENVFDFISRLLREENILYYYQQDEHEHRLILKSTDNHDKNPAIEIRPDDKSSTFRWSHTTDQYGHSFLNINTTMIDLAVMNIISFQGEKYIIEKITHHANDHGQYFNEIKARLGEYANNALEISKPAAPVRTGVIVTTDQDVVCRDNLARVKVRYDDDHEKKHAAWTPVCQYWAGLDHGLWLTPRVGEEVLIDFIDQNPDKPVLIGVLKNEQDPVIYPSQEQSGFSTPKNADSEQSLIHWDDSTRQEAFRIQTASDVVASIHQDETQQINRHSRLSVQEKHYSVTVCGKYLLNSESKISLQCGSGEIIINQQGVVFQAGVIALGT